jgi:hypothetical protein
VDEGWVLYNMFFTHFLEENKRVNHTCDPGQSL